MAGKTRNLEPPPNSPMNKKITLTWYGPIESVVHVLASAVQYKVNIVGKPPAQPVMVSMDAVDQDVYKVIENIGWQTGDDVALVRDDRGVKLRLYTRNHNGFECQNGIIGLHDSLAQLSFLCGTTGGTYGAS